MYTNQIQQATYTYQVQNNNTTNNHSKREQQWRQTCQQIQALRNVEEVEVSLGAKIVRMTMGSMEDLLFMFARIGIGSMKNRTCAFNGHALPEFRVPGATCVCLKCGSRVQPTFEQDAAVEKTSYWVDNAAMQRISDNKLQAVAQPRSLKRTQG